MKTTKTTQDAKIPHARYQNGSPSWERILVASLALSFLVLTAACSSKPTSLPENLVTLPLTDAQGRSLAYVSESNYGPKGCGAAITPSGGKVWVYALDCLMACSKFQVEHNLEGNGMCVEICR